MARIQFVIITGVSGAGKTRALHCFEDLGYFCIDNLPPLLVPKFAELCCRSQGRISRVALVIDIRGGEFFNDLSNALDFLTANGYNHEVLFLDSEDETLIRRFKETRRKHPLAGDKRVSEGLGKERAILQALKKRAGKIINTTDLTPGQLKEKIRLLFDNDDDKSRLAITVLSFGYKYGIPLDADLVFDVRFLLNPHYIEQLRDLPGTDERVREYVLKQDETKKFLGMLMKLLKFLIPRYLREGKAELIIAIGCTGGQHRSVVLADELGVLLKAQGQKVFVEHRDITKGGVRFEEDN